ncbi:hypothetical protein Pfo_017287 [Paulownia fortunei]|nr:hypothetical protein Pfo_017287 [Paulownia fortunei]
MEREACNGARGLALDCAGRTMLTEKIEGILLSVILNYLEEMRNCPVRRQYEELKICNVFG